jgi:integrase/recombinase XerD
MEYSINLFLDSRRALNGKINIYPIKLRVYSLNVKKAKLYSTNIGLTKNDFRSILDSTKTVRGKKLDYRNYLNEFVVRAEDAAKELTTFTFEAFEKKLFRNKFASSNVAYHYKKKINELQENGQIGTAENYELSLKALGMFLLQQINFPDLETKLSKIDDALKNLTFFDIDHKWLEGFERFMVKTNKRSYTTVSIYVRCLRTIFNNAINENDIKKDIYPFGKGKNQYQIPRDQKKRKSLNRSQLSILFNGSPSSTEQQKAKDFWFLSYALNGMNIKDIVLLKGSNLHEDKIVYYRQKTVATKKSNLKQASVFLNNYSKKVLGVYGDQNAKDDELIFDVVTIKDNPYIQDRKIKNFISHINLYFDKYARSLGFEFKISTYWARHSFATISIQKGASMEFISEALNHSSLNVTKNYFAGFEDETKKDFANSLMDFE